MVLPVIGYGFLSRWPAAVVTGLIPVLILLLTLLRAPFAAGQENVGVLRGQVFDPLDAAVPSVSVFAIGPDGSARTVQSDETGTFVFLGLPAGLYSVRASAPGFAAFEQKITIPGGRITALDLHLTVQTQRQEITVAGGEPSQLEVDPSANVNALKIEGQDLDMLADNPDDLQADLLALAGPSAGPNGGQIFVDGFSNGELPAKETIREVRINNNPFSSEFDTVGMGRVEVLTRPGTDRLRGTEQFNFSDNTLNARNPFAPAKPPAQMRQFAFNLTGPLTRKASFNVDASHASQDSSVLVNADVLTPALQIQHMDQILPAPNTRTNVSPRIDYAITPNVTLQGRYSWVQNSTGENGVGGFTLPSRATTSDSHHQSAQFTETAVIGSNWINENRFQFHRAYTDQYGDSSTPAINVLGAFTGGGAPFSHNYLDDRSYEFQNLSSYVNGTNLMKFGIRIRGTSQANYSTANFNGTYTFTSLASYAAALAGHGGLPSQYSVTTGQPLATVQQVDGAPWIQDDWRARPNLTLSGGLRYEIQTNLSDRRAWAPRLSLAWGLGRAPGPGRTPKTVIRAGAGIFYSRIDQMWTLQAERQNGKNQQFFVMDNPAFFLNPPSPAVLAASQQPQAIQLLDPHMTSPRILQSAVSLERQLPKNVTVSLSYMNYRGVHQSRQRNINTPVLNPATGLLDYPYQKTSYGSDPLFLYETDGMFKQTQLTLQVNARVNTRFSLFGYFNLNHADSNTDGPTNFLSNAYNAQADWGRSIYDIHQRGQIGGSITLPLRILFAPNVSASSAPPFNITTGTDLNGDTLYLDRPAYATVAPNPAAGIVKTEWGVFNLDPVHNPGAGTAIVPRDLGVAYGTIMVSGRLSRTWGFGERLAPSRQNGTGVTTASPNMSRFQLNAGIQGRNWLNHINPGPPTGNLSSPFFGQPLNLQSGSGSTANRRLELNLRLTF